MIKTLKDIGQPLGYQDKFALASMIPFDTRRPLDNPNVTLKNIQQFTFPGSVLVLHGKTLEQAANTVQVLQKLIPDLHQQGYELITFSELFNQ